MALAEDVAGLVAEQVLPPVEEVLALAAVQLVVAIAGIEQIVF